jgi:alpha-beta hydrolase superfamily lysophospholipase
MPNDDFFLTNLELRDSNEQGEVAAGLTHDTMKGMTLLSVLELAARGVPRGAVTIIHDAGDAGDRYRGLAEALAADAWAVALPDLRGHGTSEGARGHSAGLREVERDIGDILDHLAYRMPEAPKVLVGVGLGALYAAHFALAEPGVLAGLVLVNPLTSLPFTAPEKPRGLSKFFKKVTGGSLGSTGYTGALLSNDAQVASGWDANPLTHDLISLRAIEEAGRALSDSMGRLGELQCPTLVLRGDGFAGKGDVPVGESLEVLDLEGAGHHLFQGSDAGRANTALAEWLNRVLPTSD